MKIQNVLFENTHKNRSERHFLLLTNDNYKLPLTLHFKTNQLLNELQVSKNCLIIENLEVYYNYKKVLNILDLDNNDIDIIYGGGKNICNKYYYDFLNRYEKLFIFGDLDYGGYQIYISLKENLNLKVEKLYIKNINKFFNEVKKIETYKQFHNFKELTIKKYINKKKEVLTDKDIEILILMNEYEIRIEEELILKLQN